MSFDLAELTKIRKATSGSEKSKKQVANYIDLFKAKLSTISELEPGSKKMELIRLMNEESKKEKKPCQPEFPLMPTRNGPDLLLVRLGLIAF